MNVVTAIDASLKPAFLVDEAGLLKHANAAGRKALRREDYITLRSGRLEPANPEHEQQFSRLLGAVTIRNGPEVRRGVLHPFGARDASVVLFVPNAKVDGFRAVLLLSAKAHDLEIDAIRLRITFGFTSAEDRLVRDLIRGSSLKETGEKYHLGRETLKSQLSSLFRKTGTHRQGELVAFLLSSISDAAA